MIDAIEKILIVSENKLVFVDDKRESLENERMDLGKRCTSKLKYS